MSSLTDISVRIDESIGVVKAKGNPSDHPEFRINPGESIISIG